MRFGCARRGLVLVVAVLGLGAPAAAQSHPPRFDPAWHGGIAAATFIGAGMVKWLEHGAEPTCRWCGISGTGDPAAPRLDRWARTRWAWSDKRRASRLSHVAAGGAYAWPLLGLSVVRTGGEQQARDLTAVLSSMGVAQLATDVSKRLFRRARPGVVFDREPMSRLDDVHSFFSAHAASAFAASISTGTIVSRRHSRHAPWIWTGGLALAGTAGYLRIAADRHFLTDVLMGAAVGTAAGLVLPRVFDEDADPSGPVGGRAFPELVGIGPAARITLGTPAFGMRLGTGAGAVGLVAFVGMP